MLGPLDYKYFVPTGLRRFPQAGFVITHNSHHANRALPQSGATLRARESKRHRLPKMFPR